MIEKVQRRAKKIHSFSKITYEKGLNEFKMITCEMKQILYVADV